MIRTGKRPSYFLPNLSANFNSSKVTANTATMPSPAIQFPDLHFKTYDHASPPTAIAFHANNIENKNTATAMAPIAPSALTL